MALTGAQLVALKTEITTDPQTYGYAALLPANPPQWNAVADLLNKLRDGTDGETAITINRDDVTPNEVLEAIDLRDFPAAPAQVNNIPMAQSWLESITQFPSIRLFNPNGQQSIVKNNLDRLVGNTQGSQTRLNAVGKRIGTRSEQLFGIRAFVTDVEVEAAWRLP